MLENDSLSGNTSSDINVKKSEETKKIASYEIVKELGRGGMGKVFKASRKGKFFAIKVLLGSEYSEDEREVKRFLREAMGLGKLKHENIVQAYDIGKTDYHYLVMEYIDGEKLSSFIEKNYSFENIAKTMVKICNAVQYAHDNKVIHRDLKPENILVDKKGEPKVMDFGIAKFLECSTMTMDGVSMGTIGYMSPEQARGEREVDERSDVYSMGSILYKLLTGERPFEDSSHMMLVGTISDQLPKPVVEIKAGVPKELEKICMKALQKLKENRYQSAKKMAEELEKCLEDLKTGTYIKSSFIEICSKKLANGKLNLGGTNVKNKDLIVLEGNLDLEQFWLNNTKISNEGLKFLTGLTGLKVLWLNNTKINNEGLKFLAGLSGLQRLSLYKTEISNEGLQHLVGLSRLKELWLHKTRITKEGVEKLQKALPNCKIKW